MEKIAAAGGGVSLLAASALGQQKPEPQPDAENPKYSPENIGGGGRLERNFYRDWIRKSRSRWSRVTRSTTPAIRKPCRGRRSAGERFISIFRGAATRMGGTSLSSPTNTVW